MAADADKWEAAIRKYLVSDISPDADLFQIKDKCSELITVSNNLTVAYLKKRKALNDKRRTLVVIERDIGDRLNRESLGKKQTDKLDKDGRKLRTEKIIDATDGTKGIYEAVDTLEAEVSALDTIIKNNRLVAERINDMLVAESIITKIKSRAK